MQDYASRLRSLPGVETATSTLGPGSASALMGPYAGALPGAGGGATGGGYQLGLADNAPLTADQRSIIETMLSAMNNAPRVR